MNNLPNYPQEYNHDTNSSASQTFAIISFVVALVGIFCCSSTISLILGIGAIVLSIVSMHKQEPRGFAITGMVLGIVGIIAAIFKIILKVFASFEFMEALLETAKEIQPY